MQFHTILVDALSLFKLIFFWLLAWIVAHILMDHRNRKWIDINNLNEYLGGVNEFLEFAFRNRDEKVSCPCKKCVNHFHRSKKVIFDLLVEHRMIEDYDTWYCHEESLHASGVTTTLNVNKRVDNDDLNDDDDDDDDDVIDMLCDIFGVY